MEVYSYYGIHQFSENDISAAVATAEIFNLFTMFFLSMASEELEIKNVQVKCVVQLALYITTPVVMFWAMFWNLPQTALASFIIGLVNIVALSAAVYLKFIK